MAKVLTDNKHYIDIANAIRGKNGTTDTYKPSEMADAITAIESGGGGDIPEEAFVISGDCQYKFYGDGWDWFLKQYGHKVTTKDITNLNFMFASTKMEEIPFDLNCNNKAYRAASRLFDSAQFLKTIGKIINLYPDGLQGMFASCRNLRYLPEFVNLNLDRIQSYGYANCSSIFEGCYSLREIPKNLLKNMFQSSVTSAYSSITYRGFNNCSSLDEIVGLNLYKTVTVTSNLLDSYTFQNCYRLKNLIFATQEDGSPYVISMKSQTIDLLSNIGYAVSSSKHYILNYNSGITADKEVIDDATYQALKDDPDWFTTKVEYSRYNHDSAVATIQSLPDTSAYLASAGGTNTIKFYGLSGSKTDGGAINTLTEEEIAVATAKGWTVTLS